MVSSAFEPPLWTPFQSSLYRAHPDAPPRLRTLNYISFLLTWKLDGSVLYPASRRVALPHLPARRFTESFSTSDISFAFALNGGQSDDADRLAPARYYYMYCPLERGVLLPAVSRRTAGDKQVVR